MLRVTPAQWCVFTLGIETMKSLVKTVRGSHRQSRPVKGVCSGTYLLRKVLQLRKRAKRWPVIRHFGPRQGGDFWAESHTYFVTEMRPSSPPRTGPVPIH